MELSTRGTKDRNYCTSLCIPSDPPLFCLFCMDESRTAPSGPVVGWVRSGWAKKKKTRSKQQAAQGVLCVHDQGGLSVRNDAPFHREQSFYSRLRNSTLGVYKRVRHTHSALDLSIWTRYQTLSRVMSLITPERQHRSASASSMQRIHTTCWMAYTWATSKTGAAITRALEIVTGSLPSEQMYEAGVEPITVFPTQVSPTATHTLSPIWNASGKSRVWRGAYIDVRRIVLNQSKRPPPSYGACADDWSLERASLSPETSQHEQGWHFIPKPRSPPHSRGQAFGGSR